MHVSNIARRRPQLATTDLCSTFCSLYIAARLLSTSAAHRATGGSNNATPNPMHSAPAGTTKRDDKAASGLRRNRASLTSLNPTPTIDGLSAEQRRAETIRKAREAADLQAVKAMKRPDMGGLASDSLFSDKELVTDTGESPTGSRVATYANVSLGKRNPANMEQRLNPQPNTRARWTRKMVIRDVRRRGRPSREMWLARTERSHTSKSRMFKTSMKKLAPLARQIAGKSIDEAIVQMRFSKKKAAKEVLKHLIQARNEAVVVRGMGLPNPESVPKRLERVPVQITDIESVIAAVVGPNPDRMAWTTTTPPALRPATSDTPPGFNPVEITDSSNTPPLITQYPNKSLLKGTAPNPTDIYIAQAWINRGKYGKESSPRARGRVDVLRPPHTGLSVMLKEEKTRTREKREREMKAIRKRLNGKLWTHLPDRPVSRQHQHVLW